MEFLDRLLTCSDCGGEFIFTAGEQLFFFDKQFKNDPKRCKPCKSRRAGVAVRPGSGPAAAGISRTETRTSCSACGIETTVPFKPTQGRPVLCRQCFQTQRPAASAAAGSEQGQAPVEGQFNGALAGSAQRAQAASDRSSSSSDLLASILRA